MPTLLIRNARLLVTMDAQRREIAGGGVFVRDQVIEAVGLSTELLATADEVIGSPQASCRVRGVRLKYPLGKTSCETRA